MQLRWYIQETEKDVTSSWVSGIKQKYWERSKPVLQYSTDGVEWKDVSSIVERVKNE